MQYSTALKHQSRRITVLTDVPMGPSLASQAVMRPTNGLTSCGPLRLELRVAHKVPGVAFVTRHAPSACVILNANATPVGVFPVASENRTAG